MQVRKIVFLLILLSIPLGSVFAQEQSRTLTNADIINMAKSGIGEQTIILTIQKAVTKFDTTPEALIQLKTAGVSDAILNAMLNSSPAVTAPTDAVQQDCSQALDKVLASIGSREKIIAIRSLRWTGKETISSASGSSSANVERVTVFPSDVYLSIQRPTGLGTKVILTPEFNYLTSGKMTTAVPAAVIQEIQSGMKLEPIYILQHRDQYSCLLEGTEQSGNLVTTKLKVKGEDVEGLWYIDPATGRLLRTTFPLAVSGQSVTDFSDWRQVDGIYLAFSRHNIEKGGVSTDVSVTEYEVNPVLDVNLFQPPASQIVASVTLKVLQSESVPYTVQTNGGISTACNITGSINTSEIASTYGNTTYGTATSTPNLQMNCRSSDNTIRWTHVLNAMLVQASDGNAYIIACDRAWLWSKCTPLKAGDTFLAKRGGKGFVVQSLNSKSKEQEATYSVLQSKSLHE